MNELNLEGMVGEPLPYLLRSDGIVTCILFFCMMLLSYTLAKGKKYLYYQLKTFTNTRERASMFDEVTVTDIRYPILLLFNSCLLTGFCLYYFISVTSPGIFSVFSRGPLLAGLTFSLVVFLMLKMLVYKLVNWVFFQKARNVIWTVAYLNVIIWMGLLLFPVVLLVVYFGLSLSTALYWVGAIIIFAKIALFYKCFNNFFDKIHGLIHLILYFCALEILPDLILWKGIELVSNNLILNI